jgi:hypothetical protein
MWKDQELSYHSLDNRSRLRRSILGQSSHQSLQMLEIIGNTELLHEYQDLFQITELLHEYQDLFPNKFIDMKGIKGPMGEMRIPLHPDARPAKQIPYILNPKYKEKVKIGFDRMLDDLKMKKTCILENICKLNFMC